MFYTNVAQIGNRIFHRYIDSDGKRKDYFGDFAPELFVATKKPTKYRGINGEALDKVEFGGIADAREFVKEYSDISNMSIHGNQNWWAQYIAKEYPDEIDWDMSKMVIANIDIETRMDKGFPEPQYAPANVTAITIEVNNHYMVFGSKPYTAELPKNVKHEYCQTETQLLMSFINFWKQLAPDVVTGWNTDGFDLPYLYTRIKNELGEEYAQMLSPAHKYTKRCVNEKITEYGLDVNIVGLSSLDLMKMYKKFTYKMRERYSLDFIGYVELGERKLDYSEYGNLDDLYEKDYNKYIDYNIRDVELVKRIDDKLQLKMLVMTLAYMCKINHSDTFSQVRMWDTLIYNKLMEQNTIIPPKQSNSKNEKYEGAVVFDPKVGLHDWVVSFDLNSLYPSLIMQYNISPEKMVDAPDVDLAFGIKDLVSGTVDTSFLKEYDLSMTANKAFFKRDSQGFLAAMMDSLYSDRRVYKNKMLEAESDVELLKNMIKERAA